MTPRDVWDRFDAEISDSLLRGLAAAFALVATADVNIAEDEVRRFVDLVRKEPSLERVDSAVLEPLFRDLARTLMDDPETERERALDVIRGQSAKHATLIVAAAQMAIVADAHLMNVEELALNEICVALGIDPSGK